jgi:1-phosphatidylinositol-4-phosphate 5-kinase
MTKKAENFWKGLSHSRSQISPIPPESYGDRFLNFIIGTTMSKEEGERQKQSQDRGQASVDTYRSSTGFPRPSMDKTMEKADKQVLKSERTLESDPEPQDRVLRTMSSPSMDGAGPATSTLPVVEEVGEASNTGRQSLSQRRATVDPNALTTRRERNAMVNGDDHELSHLHPNNSYPRQDHIVPPTYNLDSVADNGKGKGRASDWDMPRETSSMTEKRLPPVPFHQPPPPPPSSAPPDPPQWRGSDRNPVSSN